MKAYIKLYLLYAAIFLIGASLSAGLYFAYGIRVFPTRALEIGTGFSILGMTDVAALLLTPLAFMLFGAFTLYSCFICSLSCLYTGAVTGRLAIRYCLSDHTPFTHGAVLIFLLIIGTLFVTVSKEASLCRNYMRYTAPNPADLIKTDAASSLIKSFTEAALILAVTSAAIYTLLFYFPL